MTLCGLLEQPRDPTSSVAHHWDHARGTDRPISWDRFRRDVATLFQRLRREPEGACLLLTEDAYPFAVGLFALWHSGRCAISPPNRRADSLRALQDRLACVVSDRPDWIPGGMCIDPLTEGIAGADPYELKALHPDDLAVELYTSGTTGRGELVSKRIRHLEEEVKVLESLWGDEGCTVFSTASHQHLYGLLFGVLWPLCAGRVFHGHHFLHVEEAVSRMHVSEPCVLASVPTQLMRMGRHAGTERLRGVCRRVFSSGGPLREEHAHRIAGMLGHAPVEVLGSTETGGIAWRRQDPGTREGLWTPLPSVQVRSDHETGALRVRSPFVSEPHGTHGFATGDGITMQPDGRFRLEGRLDRVVKVAEKRLDLADLESRLRAHPLIDEIALLTLDREGGARVAAVVVPSEQGWKLLEREGRRAFGHEVRSELGALYDPVLQPRHWRVRRALPENAQGKVTQAALTRLFSEVDHGASTGDAPVVQDEFRSEDSLERLCRVPDDLPCLSEHFPGNPVVPGVLQLDWALEMAEELLERALRVECIESLKFLSPLLPGQPFRMKVRIGDRGRLHLRVWREEADLATGRIQLVPQESARGIAP
jgi:acyl-coenzyme A synthetase/AMP-(fatty) acid ligase